MKKAQGFTLIELMVTLVVAAILFGVAIPGFMEMIRNNRVTTMTNDLITAFNVARTEAIKQRRRAQVCISDNQTSCNGNNWATGYLVWTDTNGNGALDNGEIVRVFQSLISGSALTLASGATSITYQPTGYLATGTATQTFTMTPPECKGKTARSIVIDTPAGRPFASAVNCP